MNIRLIQDNLANAKRRMIDVLLELEQADGQSRFHMFEPLVKRAGTITAKIESLEKIVEDLRGVRCGK